MPKDNKCDLCSKDVQTDGSNRNLLVQLVFDILSERLWTSPFTTNFQVFGKSVIMPMEDRSTSQQYCSIDTTCTGDHITANQQTVPTIDTTCTGEHTIDTTCTAEHITADQQTVRTNESTTSDEVGRRIIEFRESCERSDTDTAAGLSSTTKLLSKPDGLSCITPTVTDTTLTIERLESRVEEDAEPSYEDYSDINEQNRENNKELRGKSIHQRDSNDNWVIIYERIQKEMRKAVDCIDQRTEDALLSISREGREVLKCVNENTRVILKDSKKGKKDILILHSEEDRSLASSIMETIINESDQTVGIQVDIYEQILFGQSKVNSIDDLFNEHRWVLFLVTPEFEHNGFHNFHGGAVLVKELEDYRGTHARFVPLLSGVKRKDISRAWLRAIQPMFFPDKNFMNMIVKMVHKFRNCNT